MHIQGQQIAWEVNGQSYNGSIHETSPGHIVISGVISELHADSTPDERLLSKLMAVNQYTFRAGRLSLLDKIKSDG